MNRRALQATTLSLVLPVPVAMAAPSSTPVEQLQAMAGLPVTGVGDVVLPRLPSTVDLTSPERREDPAASFTRVAAGRRAAADAVSRITQSGIPVAALRAYRTAETTMGIADPSCRLSWAVLAGIGSVESDHGRYDGAVLRNDGRSAPAIIGVPLNGAGDVAAIADSDNGSLDGDRQWDRAVGPMQFIPSTWAMVGVDGDGDGERDPHDIDDAALAAAAYLCVGDEDLSTADGLHDAVYSYNHSNQYVGLVGSIAGAYQSGAVDLPLLTATLELPSGDGTAVDLHPGQGQPDRGPGRPKHKEAEKPTEGPRGKHVGPADRPGTADDARDPRPGTDGQRPGGRHRMDDDDRPAGRQGGTDDTGRHTDRDRGPKDAPAPAKSEPAEKKAPVAKPAPAEDGDPITKPAPDSAVPAPADAEEFSGLVSACEDGFCLDEYVLAGDWLFDEKVGQTITVLGVLDGETLMVHEIVE